MRTLLAIGLLAVCSQATATDYAIDPQQTVVTFEVRRLGISTQSGKFNRVAGTVALDSESREGSIAIAVDTHSLHAGSETMENFLRGPGVLNVEQYAAIEYKAARIAFTTSGKPERIDGELTLLGVTRPVPLTVVGYTCTHERTGEVQRCRLDATATFKRSEFGMTRYLTVVSDEVKLAIHGVADDISAE